MTFTCPVCSSNDYEEENGHYFCTECGTQSQELIVQQVDESSQIHTRYEVRTEKATSVKPKSDLGRPWTIYEAYQFIILAQADSFIKLGLPESFKETVFMIWANYLSKLGVAFCKKEKVVPNIITKMRVGRLRELHRGTMDYPLNRHKRPFLETENKPPEGTELGLHDEEFYEDDVPVTKTTDNIVFVNEDDDSDVDVVYVNCKKKQNHESRYAQASHSPEWMNMKKTIAICYIGVMLTRPDILPYDVVRWVYESKVPFLSCTHLLPSDMVLSAGDQALFETGHFDSKVFIKELNKILVYLDLKNLPTPELRFLITRFTRELNLPEEIATVSIRLTEMIPFCSTAKNKLFKRIDVPAMSYIILAVKLVFGLNDSLEWKLSEYSSAAQELGLGSKLFIWSEWKRFMIQKCANEFVAYRELTSNITHSRLSRLDQLLECYAATDPDKKRLTTCFTLNVNQRPVRCYEQEFKEAMRKPLEIALDRYYSSVKFNEDTTHACDVDWSKQGEKFQKATICHIIKFQEFKEKTSSGETDSKLNQIHAKYNLPVREITQYERVSDAEHLSSNRHESYMWFLNLASQTIDCSPLGLDKLVVIFVKYLVEKSKGHDMVGIKCSNFGFIEARVSK
ncbi:TATA box-binding protein-associated factor RNA polymerase I subunit B-like [Physella acuta]|uniref:TATA box-binding protein-associated factor RNA polymerase I subunit B-like n=1 Tax=Physella acuta TaxID=109671 RepID=UPI0027DCC844|nr:TATA box-binding protein-associated factor RNA polymerase I subunit B-like [Physella acuta]